MPTTTASTRGKDEDLCTEPLAWGRRVAQFLGLPMTAAAETYLRESIIPEKVSEYRRQDGDLVRQIERMIGGTLRRYGYEVTEEATPVIT